MSTLTVNDWLQKAKQSQFALGAFNCNNMEIMQAIASAAAQTRAPLIIQASKGAIAYAGLDYIIALSQTAQKNTGLPIFLHLDHGDYDTALTCINSGGFASVMFDGSGLPLEENIRLTQEVVNLAHQHGVFVEAEIGRVGGVEEDLSVSAKEATYTQPSEALDFVEQTNCDSLAIAIGTAHGVYTGEPVLRFDLITQISQLLPSTPLVMHGSSGVSAPDIQKAIQSGISKINIDTDIRQAFVQQLSDVIAAHPQEIDPRKILGTAREAATTVIVEKITTFGSAGQAAS
ncbi:ketose-bisphosphate aldolase [Microgenomates group bacterium]|nr:ketose-bisphosphate aldolase [Microgenomates group bacterium]